MAEVKISALPAATPTTGTELVVIVQGGVTKRATAADFIGGTGVTLTTAQVITGQKTFQPATTTTVGLIVKGLASQTANLQEWQDSAGGVLGALTPQGHFVLGARDPFTSNGNVGRILEVRSAGNTNAFLTLSSGTISGSQSGGGVEIRNLDATAGDRRLGQFSFGRLADVTAGQLTSYFELYINANGTLTRAFRVNGDTGHVGIMEGSPGARLHVSGGAAASSIVSIMRGATGQTADLQQWQDSAGAVLLRTAADGRFGTTDDLQYINNIAAGSTVARFTAKAAGQTALWLQGAASQTADLQQWRDSAGTALARVASNGAAAFGGSGIVGRLNIYTVAAATPGIMVRGAASQTANLQEWQDSAGTVLALVNSGGGFFGSQARIGINDDGGASGPIISLGNLTTAPTGNLAGGVLYAEGGALKWRGSAGTVTTVAAA